MTNVDSAMHYPLTRYSLLLAVRQVFFGHRDHGESRAFSLFRERERERERIKRKIRLGGTTRYSMLATTFDGEGLGENLEHPGEESVHLGLIRFYEIMKFLEIDFSAFEAVREIINQREGVVVEPCRQGLIQLQKLDG